MITLVKKKQIKIVKHIKSDTSTSIVREEGEILKISVNAFLVLC